jgi:hypothetical protein
MPDAAGNASPAPIGHVLLLNALSSRAAVGARFRGMKLRM